MLYIGTSGWHYDDWINEFYPNFLKNKKDKWLEYYANYFNTVEIDSTYYSFPSERTVSSWLGKLKKLQHHDRKFTFSLKIPKNITHEFLINGSVDKAIESTSDFEQKVALKIKRNNSLAAILIQLSPYFSYEKINLLEKYFSSIDSSNYDYAVEFRNKSWLGNNDGLKNEVVNLLSRYNIASCITDGPAFPILTNTTANHAYIRFHGRNHDLWFNKEKSPTDTRINKYDYFYSENELKPWAENIKSINSSSLNTRIYFNNHPHAHAVKNALSMMNLLDISTYAHTPQAKLI
ncbi:MAG: DUF72 domain-containing protein [Thermoplasmata archaeon]